MTRSTGALMAAAVTIIRIERIAWRAFFLHRGGLLRQTEPA
jgi:hypothetical protein